MKTIDYSKNEELAVNLAIAQELNYNDNYVLCIPQEQLNQLIEQAAIQIKASKIEGEDITFQYEPYHQAVTQLLTGIMSQLQKTKIMCPNNKCTEPMIGNDRAYLCRRCDNFIFNNDEEWLAFKSKQACKFAWYAATAATWRVVAAAARPAVAAAARPAVAAAAAVSAVSVPINTDSSFINLYKKMKLKAFW